MKYLQPPKSYLLALLSDGTNTNRILSSRTFFWIRILDIYLNRKGGYGVNIHDTKISYVRENSKQRNSALISFLLISKLLFQGEIYECL